MVVFGKDVVEVPMAEGVSRKLLSYSKDLMVCEVKLDKGSEVKEHTHPHEQISYIISGKCLYTLDGQQYEMAGGDSILLPGNLPHSVIMLEDTLILDVFTPAREDFL